MSIKAFSRSIVHECREDGESDSRERREKLGRNAETRRAQRLRGEVCAEGESKIRDLGSDRGHRVVVVIWGAFVSKPAPLKS